MLLLVSCWWSASWAGPVYDPFLEKFQVGTYTNPDEIDMVGAWPAGLMTPVQVDSVWCRQAWDFLDPSGTTTGLTHDVFGELEKLDSGASALRMTHLRYLTQVSDPRTTFIADDYFLRKEAWAVSIFQQLERGHPGMAAQLTRLGLDSSLLTLRPRERFVWEMRWRFLTQLDGQTFVPLTKPWTTQTTLGPFDRGAVWALWVAHCRAVDQTLIPASWTSFDEASRLAGLSRPHFSPDELYRSSFPPELKAGLGATLFSGKELAAHLERYPQPPNGFSAQGWWVKGQRFLKRGQAAHYEQLAARPDLKPGWKMDILRRASEIRLLNGQWAQGLDNLQKALAIAKKDGGTRSQRRRLRHWVEQAAVLAMNQGRQDSAQQLIGWGDQSFHGEALKVWYDETRHWRDNPVGVETSSELLNVSRDRVDAGNASPLASRSRPQERSFSEELVQAANSDLWAIWVKWGIALSDTTSLPQSRKAPALEYRNHLLAFDSQHEGLQIPPAALAAVVERLHSRTEIWDALVTKIIDRDLGLKHGWRSPPEPSPIPKLLPALRRSQLDMHAALGVTLATGDMRGTVALGFELPGHGLTRMEKRRFLYPLPGLGPIRDALLEAESEPALILAVARNESLFEPAVRSRAGALGWMQIMPFHFPDKGAQPGLDHWGIPAVSIAKGDQLLTENSRRYNGDPYMTLAAYNAGPGAAKRWLDQLGGQAPSDIYLAWIGYTETRSYVEKVLIDREIYDWILRDGSR